MTLRRELLYLLQRTGDVRQFSSSAARIVRRFVPCDGVRVVTMDPATGLETGAFGEMEQGDHELRAALVSGSAVWGEITLRRRRPFTGPEVELMACASRLLADGLRRALVLPVRPNGGGSPGLVLLAADNSIIAADAWAATWLDELGGPLPLVVAAVADRARNLATEAPARARVRAHSGAWLTARASTLAAQTAVTIEPARPHELAPLIADAYELTARERAVTQLVAHGLGTEAIAARLRISAWTVQDHLKSAFEKVGATSRGELVARLFFDHYALRLTS